MPDQKDTTPPNISLAETPPKKKDDNPNRPVTVSEFIKTVDDLPKSAVPTVMKEILSALNKKSKEPKDRKRKATIADFRKLYDEYMGATAMPKKRQYPIDHPEHPENKKKRVAAKEKKQGDK